MSNHGSNLPPSPGAIRAYYDQNTRLFLRFGSSQKAQTIHRAVWAPGVNRLEDALNTSNNLLLEEIDHLPQIAGRLQVADLGCGVGATLFHLLPLLGRPVQAVGLTISPVQARLARRKQPASLVPAACDFVEADFHNPPLAGGFDFVYSIEAYVHASDPAAYLRGAAGLLATGGRLALCDDFLAEHAARPGLDANAASWLAAYQDGWYVPNLRPIADTIALAGEFGLRLLSNRELTPYLRLRALPDGLARLLLAVGMRLPQRHAIIPSMLGSMALQQCLKAGLIRYHFLVFEKMDQT